MKFIVTSCEPIVYEADTAYLIKGSLYRGKYDDSWNDYGFRTIYTLQYCDIAQQKTVIGCVKIGEFGMDENQCVPDLPAQFNELNNKRFFSISSDETYYQKIASIENDKGYDILLALNDFTMRSDVYEKAKNEQVTVLSLLRDTKESEYDDYIRERFEWLTPPINLMTMRKIFGSTGWRDIDRGLVEMQRLLSSASIHYYYNAIATIGREIIKGVAGKIYDDELHRDKTQFPQPPTDDQFINKLHGYVDFSYKKGDISENVKNYLKSTIVLVQGYVHKEEAENFECFLCVHAVISLVFQISIISKKEKYNEVTS